jgi:amino acid transporter
MGLPAALAVGVGTMVGAGIFVFPGLVADRVGPPGLFSFLLAGLVALTVAVYTAELSTAMPLSGGGYTFTERIFGRAAGATVGLAQWAGLIFASAFYLASFTTYVASLLAELGLQTPPWLPHLGPGAALALTALNVFGSRGAGALQKYLVVVLTSVLATVFLYGLARVAVPGAELSGAPLVGFLPDAGLPVVTGAALIFTAYIGFVQIATVGGEIRAPRRNLPRALIGSVLIVLLLYLLVYFVSARLVSAEELAGMGETAVVRVAGRLVGVAGVVATLGAGLLATLSSANASILSSSRTLYALARDGAVPGVFARTRPETASPVFAVLSVGVPAAGLAYVGVEALAEVASLLHLVVYGLICGAVFARRRRGEEDESHFRAPGPAAFALLAAVACFSLIAFMQPRSIVAGVAVLLAALAVHVAYRFLRRRPADG